MVDKFIHFNWLYLDEIPLTALRGTQTYELS